MRYTTALYLKTYLKRSQSGSRTPRLCRNLYLVNKGRKPGIEELELKYGEQTLCTVLMRVDLNCFYQS